MKQLISSSATGQEFLGSSSSDLTGRRARSQTKRIQPFLPGKRLPLAACSETTAEYRVVVPIAGMDLQQLFIVATSQTLLIELRERETVPHEENGPVFSETQERRTSRELRFRCPIEKGVCLQVHDRELWITCRKASTAEEQSWSEWLRFDTRASLGCI